MVQRPYKGMRVRNISTFAPIPKGTTGEVAEVATFGGRSIYSDPAKRMVFVRWDNGAQVAVFKTELEKE